MTALAGGWMLSATASALTLYDPGDAALPLPAQQGWSTAGTGAPAGSQGVVNGLLEFSSTGSGAFGNGRTSPQALDTASGFVLRWQLRLNSEAHTSPNRAGFSLLVQGADETKALELGFWSDTVWALEFQSGGADSGYVRGASAPFATGQALSTYTLAVQNQQFTLSADGSVLLAGALRDYPTQGLSTLPYGFASYVFFGDNSSRGTSTATIGRIELLPIPEPGALALLALGLPLVLARARRARA